MNASDMDLLVEQFSDSVYRYCKGITYTLEDAEDLYQQTFLKAFELQKKISKDGNPKAYLMSIATNLWRNHKSRYARRERIAPTISSEEEGLQIQDSQTEGSILDDIVKRESIAQLKKCVEELPQKQRQVILLFYAGELSVEGISKALKIPKGTVKSRLNKARLSLREKMEAQGYGTE